MPTGAFSYLGVFNAMSSDQIGEPTGFGLSGIPEFDTDKVVDWTCPQCGENGYHRRGLADYYVICTNRDCAVKLFSVFREGDDP